ncbi:DsbA family oxidoreductase [Oceanibacterium hippocampi]|uniref:DSBA-like thioredoxin domain protein n=1 Tax=Oceanibacterium hippocampi TaxID=745714 RepID=A0A1Y5T3S6_9PROT|nr:DsbA family oxidoreductase [Oceanibacterium hippocampi]SLN55067.1 DSBA-like thioredoxin domain protein [Oceanibacterium hippocampi]
MQIDIVSDTVCPWCYIGKRKLEAALAQRPDLKPDIHWRAFQLNPDMPAEGMDRATYLAAKFGGAEAAGKVYGQIEAAARRAGLDLDFAGIPRSPNTIDSHRLIHWSHSTGLQNEVSEALFRAYFIENRDIGSAEVLTEVAAGAGMDAALVRDLLAGDSDRDRIREEDASARQMGINGVPFFIFNRQYAVSGAQDPEVFLQVFERIEQDRKNPPAAAD